MGPSPYLEIGRIINTHGVRGEMKVEPWADGPEQLQALKTVWLDGRGLTVRRWRVQGRFMILSLETVDTLEAAMALKGKVLLADRDAMPLPEGRYYLQDLIGLPVRSDDGADLGTLAEVLDLPQGQVYIVRGEREILIPDVPEFILELNPETGLTVHLIEGM